MNETNHAYAEALEGGYDVEHFPAPTVPDVVPVAVVGPVAVEEKPTRMWTTGQLSITTPGEIRELIGANPTRVRLVLLVIDGAVYVGPDRNLSADSGFFLFSGLPFEFTTRHQIFIMPSGTDPVRVSWFAEFLDG